MSKFTQEFFSTLTYSDIYNMRAKGEEVLCPHCGTDLDNGISCHGDDVNGKALKHVEFELECMACGNEFGRPVHNRTRKSVTHVGKSGKRETVSVKQWLRANPKATYAEALAYVLSTGRSETTLKIQSRALGMFLKGQK